MKWVQSADSGYTHEFELQGDESTTIRIIARDRDTALQKLKSIFGNEAEVEMFEEE